MKASLVFLGVTLVLISAGQVVQGGSDDVVSHAGCMSKEDVIWYSNRSKSGIPRTCTPSVLAHNLKQLNSQ